MGLLIINLINLLSSNKCIVLSDIDYECDFDAVIGSYGSNGVQFWTNDESGVFGLCFENNNSVYARDIALPV